MNRIENYSEYFNSHDDKQTSDLFYSYLNEDISFENFELNFLNINENFANKIKNKIFTLLNRILENLNKLGTKIIALLNTVFTLAKKVIQSNPKLFKVIIIVAVIILLSSASALAASNQPTESTMVLETAVGYLNQLPKTKEFSIQDMIEAKGVLLAVKQNMATNLDDENLRSMFSERSIHMAKAAKRIVIEMAQRNDFDVIEKLWEEGSKYVLDFFQQAGTKTIKIHT